MSKKRQNESDIREEKRLGYDVSDGSRRNIEEEEISLKELVLVLLRGKRILILSMVTVMVVAFFGSILAVNVTIGSKGTVQSAIKLSFQGIEQGKTPDRTPYDPNEIKSVDIIRRAMNQVKLSGNPTPSQIAECITLEGVIPDNAAKTLQTINELTTEQLKLEQLEKLEIHPDTYIVSLRIANKLRISKEEGRELLDQILLEYQQLLMEKYAGYKAIDNIFSEKNNQWNNFDYIQIVDLMNTHTNTLRKYIEENIKDEEFHSSSTGLSKTDLLEEIETIQITDIEQMYAKIAANLLTKDLGKHVAVYSQLTSEKNREYGKKQSEANELLTLIQNYKRNNQTLMLGDNEENRFTLQTQDSNYDALVLQYIDAGQQAAEEQSAALYYQREMERFQTASSVVGPDSEAAKEIETLISHAKEKVALWTEMTNQTVKDYYWNSPDMKYGKQLMPSQNVEKQTNINLLLNTGIGLIGGLLLGILIVLFQAYLKEEKEHMEEDGDVN